jgi:hypothetical protein
VDLKVEEVEVALLGVVAWAVEETEVLVALVEGDCIVLHQTHFHFTFFFGGVCVKWGIFTFQRTRHGYERSW